MSKEITLEQLEEWLLAYAERLIEAEPYLTELDAAIGDADHGVNMRRGAEQLRQRLTNGEEFPEIATFLRTIAMTLISSIGGAAGALYGSFFLHAARHASQLMRDEDLWCACSLEHFAQISRSGLKGVKQRGKAEQGDKTMIDALEPAIEALEEAARSDWTIAEAINAAHKSAEEGMHATIQLEARRGRASYLGPRSVNHQDPGATSAYYLFETAAKLV